MQLVAYGAQDVYLTANPQVTFFKQLYRRHSNFAMEAIEQTFNGVGNFGKRVQSTISRNGDLITKVYVQVTLPAIDDTVIVGGCDFKWVPALGDFLIDNVTVEIGGQQIDKHYGQWLYIWNCLTLPPGITNGYKYMVSGQSGTPNGTCTPCAEPGQINGCLQEKTMYIPLEFWFNRHTGLALPLIALQYHEVKINVDFVPLQYLLNITGGSASDQSASFTNLSKLGMVACSLFVDYIYLDTEERRRFAQVAHEYLIEQLQFTGTESVTSTSNKIKLQFNHPCKEIVWTVQNPSYLDCTYQNNNPTNFVDAYNNNSTAVAKIQLNGQDRFVEREGSYFGVVQPYQHHTNSIGSFQVETTETAEDVANSGGSINVYSFALKPEQIQPSGSCNFSRIDNAVLNLTLTPNSFGTTTNEKENTSVNVNVYATNYNVLRIMSGMGGLAYSN
jgi:hypothetical protein